MADRDDFYALDNYSFEKCVKILEEYKETRFQIDALLTSLSVGGKTTIETVNALEECFKQFGKSNTVRLHLSILDQIKTEKFSAEAD